MRNAGIPLDLQTRVARGGGLLPHPRRRRGILFGFCLRDVSDGISLALRIMGWEKVIYLLKYPKPEFVKAPEEKDPTLLTEIPVGKIFDVEDMDKEPEEIKLIEPEDM